MELSISVQEVEVDQDIMGGSPVFKGTRVPVDILLDYLEAGDNIALFLENYPTVKKEQIIDVLDSLRIRA